jgi:SAM-dependent methyltransferase
MEDDRLNPKLSHPSFLVRIAIKNEVIAFADRLRSRSDRATVLDFGCWRAPYRSIFTTRGITHIGYDVANHGGADLVGPATGGLPFRDGSVDAILCTQVLQEADCPPVLLAELRRVLKTGGQILLTAPGAYSMYSDTDRWRWSAAGFRELFNEWDDVTVRPQGGGVQCCMQLFVRVLSLLANDHPRLLSFVAAILIPFFNLIAPRADRLLRVDTLTVNYAVLASKR